MLKPFLLADAFLKYKGFYLNIREYFYRLIV